MYLTETSTPTRGRPTESYLETVLLHKSPLVSGCTVTACVSWKRTVYMYLVCDYSDLIPDHNSLLCIGSKRTESNSVVKKKQKKSGLTLQKLFFVCQLKSVHYRYPIVTKETPTPFSSRKSKLFF
jgi:hypothetical protein